MSQKEARRPGLVQAALAEKITNAEGARALGLSVRQFRRLKSAYRTRGLPVADRCSERLLWLTTAC